MFKPVWIAFSLLQERHKAKFLFLVIARALIQLVDFLGLAAVGLIAALLASGLQAGEEVTFLGISIEFSSSETLLWLVLATGFIFVAKSAISAVLLRATTKLLARIEAETATEIFRYLFSGRLERLKLFSPGEHVWFAVPASNLSFSVMLYSGSAIVTESALFATVFLVFVVVDASTALFILVYFLLIAVLFQVTINQRLKRLGKRLEENTINSNDSVLDITGAFREVTVLRRLNYFVDKFEKVRLQLASDSALFRFVLGLPRFLVEVALMVGFVTLMVWQFLRGSLEESLVITGVFLTGGLRMMAALLPLQNAVAEIRTRSAEVGRALELLGEARKFADSSDLGSVLPSRPGVSKAIEVVFEEVGFSYSRSSGPVLSSINLRINPGSFVAFVGPSGAGKSTVADLILGLLEPTSGRVLVDGLAPGKFRAERPGSLAYVPQKPGMVAGSIAQNVALGVPDEDVELDRVRQVLERAGLKTLIDNLPDGIESNLGKRLDGLSGGQIQRLGIARALYFRPTLLVLDEATSALDAETEHFVTQEILSLAGEITVVVIAHRLSTIQGAQEVFVLDRGELVTSGSLSEVRKKVPRIERYVELMTIRGPGA